MCCTERDPVQAPAGPEYQEYDCRELCDVDNPLCGEHGAARVYAPQKGATPAQVVELEAGLRHLAARCGGDPACPGAGAAGGAAFGLAALCGARLTRGIDRRLQPESNAAY